MPVVCGIRFRGVGKVYYFSPKKDLELEANDPVIVETARGLEMGWVVFPHNEVPDSEIVGELKPVLRRPCTEEHSSLPPSAAWTFEIWWVTSRGYSARASIYGRLASGTKPNSSEASASAVGRYAVLLG